MNKQIKRETVQHGLNIVSLKQQVDKCEKLINFLKLVKIIHQTMPVL